MKYGLDLASAGAAGDARTMGELAHIAEEAGFDGVFLEDYIVWQGHQEIPTYDPWITLAAMALRTARVRLGTMVTPLARRRPWKLAQELVTLDHLSNGRMILGVGLGDTGESVGADPSFLHFGEERNIKKRAGMLDEAIEIIVRIWRGEPFSFDGEFYKIREVQVLPRPVQKPRIPIWVGGGYPNRGPVLRAARWDGACLYREKVHRLEADDIREMKRIILEKRGSLDGYDIAVGGDVRRENWEEQREYMRALAEEGVTWWHEYIPPDTGDFSTIKKLVERGPLRID